MSGRSMKIARRKMKQYAADNFVELLNGLEKVNFITRFKVALKIIFNKYRKQKNE